MLYEGKVLDPNIVSILFSNFLIFCMGCHLPFKCNIDSLLLWIQCKRDVRLFLKKREAGWFVFRK